jgi:mRNA interferase YafQ
LNSDWENRKDGAGSNEPPRREVSYTNAFKKDLKKARSHKKCDVEELRRAMEELECYQELAPKHRDHPLTGRYPDRRGGESDCRECHVCNDWLLIYRFPDEKSVQFIRTGTHSELFG